MGVGLIDGSMDGCNINTRTQYPMRSAFPFVGHLFEEDGVERVFGGGFWWWMAAEVVARDTNFLSTCDDPSFLSH